MKLHILKNKVLYSQKNPGYKNQLISTIVTCSICLCFSSCATTDTSKGGGTQKPLQASSPVAQVKATPVAPQVNSVPKPIPKEYSPRSREFRLPEKWEYNISPGETADVAKDWLYMLEYQVWENLGVCLQSSGRNLDQNLKGLESSVSDAIRATDLKKGLGFQRILEAEKSLNDQLNTLPKTEMYKQLREASLKVKQELQLVKELVGIQQFVYVGLKKNIEDSQVFYVEAVDVLGSNAAAIEVQKQLERLNKDWKAFEPIRKIEK